MSRKVPSWKARELEQQRRDREELERLRAEKQEREQMTAETAEPESEPPAPPTPEEARAPGASQHRAPSPQEQAEGGRAETSVNVQVSTPQQWSVGAGIAAAPLVYIAAALGCPIVGCLALLVIPALLVTLVYVWPIGAAGLATGLLLHARSLRTEQKNLWIVVSWLVAIAVCVVIYIAIPPP